jgi:LysM repeat protein
VLVPTATTVRAMRNVPDPSIEKYATAVGNVYVVRKGDTLSKIADRNHTTVAALKRVNRLKGDILSVGQKLHIR